MNGYFTAFSIVPAECPPFSIPACSTCCCASSGNVEFYVPSEGEPICTAEDVVYEVKFTATWTGTCHPNYYSYGGAHWSPLTGISHKPEYELWDACMYDVSPGVATVSQTGGTCKHFCYLHFNNEEVSNEQSLTIL